MVHMWGHVCMSVWNVLAFSHNWRCSEVSVVLIGRPVKKMAFTSGIQGCLPASLSVFLPILERSLCLAPLSPRRAKPRKG